MIDWNVPEVEPQDCNPEVFSDGKAVALLYQGKGRMWHIEALIREVARASDTVGKTDWSYTAGRAIVRTVGDADKVSKAIVDLWPQYAQTFANAQIQLL